jgi:hypothetical protein
VVVLALLVQLTFAGVRRLIVPAGLRSQSKGLR